MMKRTRVALSLLLVICLLISGTPVAKSAVAVATDNLTNKAATEALTSEVVSADETVKNDNITIVKEDVALRGMYEKHFLMSDGSYQVALYNEPVHKIEGGEWIEIDNTLTLQTASDGTVQYATIDGLADVGFAKTYDGQLVTIQQEDYSVSWGVEAVSNNTSIMASGSAKLSTKLEQPIVIEPIEAELVADDLSKFSTEEQKTLAVKSSSTIQYSNALGQNVDLEYIVLPSRVKENIILQSAQEISYYVVTVYTENLSARLLENREIEFYNDSDKVIFTMTSPYMYDSAGELSEDIAVTMVSKGNGCYLIKMTPDAQWLGDEDRVYPVVIDPQVSVDTARTNIIDNYVLEGAGVQNRNLDRLYIGNRSEGLARTFIRYATMPTVPLGANITSAVMTLTLLSGTKTAAEAAAYQVDSAWQSDTIQWSNMPTSDTSLEINISHNNKTKYQFSCLEAVRDWYAGSTTGQNQNHGIMLKYYDETVADYNAVYSADYTNASKRPSLIITYGGYGGGASFASAENIYLDESEYVTTIYENEERYFKFIPPVDGVYLFYSSNAGLGSDPYLRVYNASQSQIDSNDDTGGNYNFSLSITLTGGATYNIGVKHAGMEIGSFYLKVLIAATNISVSEGHLKNVGSLRYVDIHGPEEQELVHQSRYHAEAHARWTIEKQSDGYYTIRSAYGNRYYVGISDTELGTNNVVLCPALSNYTSWRIYAKSTGELFIEPKSAPGKVLFVPNDAAGCELQLAYISSSVTNHNIWKIEFRSNISPEGQRWTNWCWAASARMFENHYAIVPVSRSQNDAVYAVKGGIINAKGTLSEAEEAAGYYSTGDTQTNPHVLSRQFGQIFSEAALRSILDHGDVLYITRGWYTPNNQKMDGHASTIVGYSTVFINGSMSYRYIVYDPNPRPEDKPNPWDAPQITFGQSYLASYAWICNGSNGLLGDPPPDIGIWDGYIVVEEARPSTTVNPVWNS